MFKIKFRKQKKATGLARISDGTPSIEVLVCGADHENDNTIAIIYFNDAAFSRVSGISICIKVPASHFQTLQKDWRWCTLRNIRPTTGEEAMKWCRDNIDFLEYHCYRRGYEKWF